MKKVLITGGTGALGEELIKLLSPQNKYNIYFTYAKSKQKADTLAKQFNVKPIQVVDLDINNVPKDFDIIINSAGFPGFGGLTHTVDDKLMQEAFDVNVMLPFKLSKLVLPHMINKNWGRI